MTGDSSGDDGVECYSGTESLQTLFRCCAKSCSFPVKPEEGTENEATTSQNMHYIQEHVSTHRVPFFAFDDLLSLHEQLSVPEAQPTPPHLLNYKSFKTSVREY